MSKSAVEIDFFQMEKQNASAKPPPPPPASPPGRPAGAPLRGIQSLVSRINPQLLKTAMVAGIPAGTRPPLSSSPSSPTAPPPVLNPAASRGAAAAASLFPTGRALLTIFYNGTVAAFDVPPDQAEVIIKMAEAGVAGSPAPEKEESCSPAEDGGGQLVGDLPIARRKSLQTFLEKRKGSELGSAAIQTSSSTTSNGSSCGRCNSFSPRPSSSSSSSSSAGTLPPAAAPGGSSDNEGLSIPAATALDDGRRLLSLPSGKPHRSSDPAWAAIRGLGFDVVGSGDFKLLRRLGRGDVGAVYFCRLCDDDHQTRPPCSPPAVHFFPDDSSIYASPSPSSASSSDGVGNQRRHRGDWARRWALQR